MIDDNTIIDGANVVTPFGDLMEMDDEKYRDFEEKMGIQGHVSNNTLSCSSKLDDVNPMPIIPHHNSSPIRIRVFSEGPKKKINQKEEAKQKERLLTMSDSTSKTVGFDLIEIKANENIGDDEFIIQGDDENNGAITPFGSIQDKALKGPNHNSKTNGY